MKRTAVEVLKSLKIRVAQLEKEAGMFDIFSAVKRQIRSEEKALKRQLERSRGVDSVEVKISNDKKHYRGVDLYKMNLKVSYAGEMFDLVGTRVERVGYKQASPMIFFDQARRRPPSKGGVPASYIRQQVNPSSVEERVHYSIHFPRRGGYSIKVYPEGHKLHSRSKELKTIFEDLEMYRGY